jgi:hypothetical protein
MMGTKKYTSFKIVRVQRNPRAISSTKTQNCRTAWVSFCMLCIPSCTFLRSLSRLPTATSAWATPSSTGSPVSPRILSPVQNAGVQVTLPQSLINTE